MLSIFETSQRDRRGLGDCRALWGCLVLVGLFGLSVHPANGQVDSTEAVGADTTVSPADTTARAPADTARRVRPDTSDQRKELPAEPQSFGKPVYGRPPIDSLPTLTPHGGLEHILAETPSSFLYDLGAVGWPHGWSPNGLGPHRSRLWIDGHSYNSPFTGRARYDLVPPSFLKQPGVGVDPGGSAVGVHLTWRDYEPIRPITELRYRRDSNGQQAVEVSHSQKHQLSVFESTGIFQVTFGFGGRTAEGAYDGSSLRKERRIWGRLRYQLDEWAFEVSDLSSRHRIGAHSGLVPDTDLPFSSIYVLPLCETCSVNAGARRRTFRNDLTARARGPIFPGLSDPMEVSATWTSNTFSFQTGGQTSDSLASGAEPSDTTWNVRMNGGHGAIQQSISVGAHALTIGARGRIWEVAATNVPNVRGTRWATHAFARDSVGLGAHRMVLDAGWHSTADQQYPSAGIELGGPFGPFHVMASVEATGQRLSWIETAGFVDLVRPLSDVPSNVFGRILQGEAEIEAEAGPFDFALKGFGHQIRQAIDLYAPPVSSQQAPAPDSVVARQNPDPVRRVGATASIGWRRDARRGIYLSGRGTALTTLNSRTSRLHLRLARTLPRVYGQGRIGARFVFFEDLITDLYVQARGWSAMNSRWFHPPTGRFVVPPLGEPVPVAPGFIPGPNGTIDIHAEIKLRGATLFFGLENAQSSFASPRRSAFQRFQRQASLTPGTFVVPVYPLPARRFRFGVHWPIFD